jgi:hypothetical protein
MAIYKLIQNTPLGPDEIQRLVAAYEETLRALGLKARDDPMTQMLQRRCLKSANRHRRPVRDF